MEFSCQMPVAITSGQAVVKKSTLSVTVTGMPHSLADGDEMLRLHTRLSITRQVRSSLSLMPNVLLAVWAVGSIPKRLLASTLHSIIDFCQWVEWAMKWLDMLPVLLPHKVSWFDRPLKSGESCIIKGERNPIRVTMLRMSTDVASNALNVAM